MSELPRLTVRWILTEYLMNPFVVWGIALLVLDQLNDHVTPVAQFLELLWAKHLYLTFLFSMFILDISMSFLPYRNGLRGLVRHRQTVILVAMLIIPLIIFILGEVELSALKSIIIMGHQIPQIVKDQDIFKQSETIIFVMSLIIIPASHIYSKGNLIRNMRNHGFLIRDPIDTEKFIPIVWMNFIFLLISFVVTNQFIKA